MPEPLDAVMLSGRCVRLEPLSLDHVPTLVAAAGGPRDTFGLTWVPEANEAAVRTYVEVALAARAAGTALPFATVRIDADGPGTVVGSTRFMNAEYWAWPMSLPKPASVSDRKGPEAVEIGSTWLNSTAQRTSVNTEAKLLMLAHAFETWDCLRVTLRTDERNIRSRANIERIGASFEGILRNQMYAYDGGIRHTATYALLAEDWPAAKVALAARLRD